MKGTITVECGMYKKTICKHYCKYIIAGKCIYIQAIKN